MADIKDTAQHSALDFGFGSLGSIFQSVLGVATSKRNADLQYQYNKQLADDAYQRQLDFWNLQNAYNSPKAQISRLRQAGLNPALLNGGVQGNTAGNLSSVPTGSISSPSSVATSSPASSLGATADIMSKLSDADLVNEQTKYWIKQAIGAGIENDTRKMLRAQGWSKAALDEMDRAAQWSAAHPDEDLPDNPYFQDWAISPDGINKYVTQDREAQARINEIVNRIENDDLRLLLEQSDFELEKALKLVRNKYSERMHEQEYNKLIAETFVLWSQKTLNDAKQYESSTQADWTRRDRIRRDQLHDADLLIKEIEASNLLADTDLKKLQAYKERLKMSGPSWDLKEINDFIGIVVTDILPDFIDNLI